MMERCAARQQYLHNYAFAGGTVLWTFVLLFVVFSFFVVCSDFAGYKNTADTRLQFSQEKRMNLNPVNGKKHFETVWP